VLLDPKETRENKDQKERQETKDKMETLVRPDLKERLATLANLETEALRAPVASLASRVPLDLPDHVVCRATGVPLESEALRDRREKNQVTSTSGRSA